MQLSSVLSQSNVLLNLFVRSAGAYLLLLVACRLIPQPRLRFWLWLLFLVVTCGLWLQLLLPNPLAGAGQQIAMVSAPSPLGTTLTLSLPVAQRHLQIWANVADWATPLYFFLIVVFLLRWCVQWLTLRFVLLRAAEPASGAVQESFDTLCREQQISPPALLIVSGLRSPSTAFWWRPMVLMPEALPDFVERDQLEDMFRHELVHIARRDYLLDRLAALACCLVFFHPAMWLAYAQLRREREVSCDEAVTGSKVERRLQYAECLLKLARWRTLTDANRGGGVDFFSVRSPLFKRVHSLVEPTPSSPWARTFQNAAAILILSASALLPVVNIHALMAAASDIADAHSRGRARPVQRQGATRVKLARRRSLEKLVGRGPALVSSKTSLQLFASPDSQPTLQLEESRAAQLSAPDSPLYGGMTHTNSTDEAGDGTTGSWSEVPPGVPQSASAGNTRQTAGRILMNAGIVVLQKIGQHGADEEQKGEH